MKKGKLITIIVCSVVGLSVLGVVGYYGINKLSYISEFNDKVAILKKNPEYIEGKEFIFEYVVDDEQATKVIDRYELNTVATGNSEFEKARKIMNKYSPMMKHESNLQNWDYTKENALDIYDYSIRDGNGINCKVKSKMFQECCLALGIKSRRVWMMPFDIKDSECHVIVEIFDKGYNKWIALDYTNNQYFSVDGIPCSASEIHNALLNDKDLKINFEFELGFSGFFDSFEDYMFSYYAKNSAYILYEGISSYGVVKNKYATVMPKGYEIDKYAEKSGITELIPISYADANKE